MWNGWAAVRYGYTFSQTEVTSLALMSNLGNYLLLDAGAVIGRFGTIPCMACGCGLACVGYLALWWSVAWVPGQVPFPVLAFFCWLSTRPFPIRTPSSSCRSTGR